MYSADEIKALTRLPSPLRMIALRIKANRKIRYVDSTFILTISESTFKTMTSIFDVCYWVSFITLAVVYIYFLKSHHVILLYTMAFSIFLLVVWGIYSPEYYSARLFLLAHKSKDKNRKTPIQETK